MKTLISKLMCRPLLAIGIILATISSSAAQCFGGSSTKSCSCPWGTHQAGSNGVKMSTVWCGSPCPMCTQDESPRPRRQPSGAPPDIADEPRSEAKTADEKGEAPSDDAERYWRVSNSCAPAWRYFTGEAAHGAFAVTKIARNGGCGWSWSPRRPIETMRREALATCAKYGPDCKIIKEK